MSGFDKLEWQRNNRKLKGYDRKYEKTPSGFLMRLYRNMFSRITGIQKEKFYLYEGKELLTKEEFYNWAKSHPDFLALYETWRASNYSRQLTPSVDRQDPEKGYIISNMQWTTHSDNSKRTTRNLNAKLKKDGKVYN